jgi:hypothetical protein
MLRARIVLAAAQGEENKQIAERLGTTPKTALKWRKHFFQEGLVGLASGIGRAGRAPFAPAVIAEVKAIACELPALRAVPLRRFSVADVGEEAIACGLVEQVMASETYASAMRVFGWSTTAAPIGPGTIHRLEGDWPNLPLVPLPVHASWLNQVEIYLSICQRKVLTPQRLRRP